MDNTFQPFNRRVDVSRRRLPHWEQAGATYFVTFRTADALPASVLKNLGEQKDVWFRRHSSPLSPEDLDQYSRWILSRFDDWLDQGYGACHLGNPEVSRIVVDTLQHFDGQRYFLDEYVVMPNHVHSLVKPAEGCTLKKILHSWKSYSASQINTVLRTRGRFWMPESFDRIVRDWAELERIRRYIRENPQKAGLREREFRLGTGLGISGR